MAEIQTFQRIRDLRDREKQQNHKVYQDAVNDFEKQAEKLYECLRKKELAEKSFEEEMKNQTVRADAIVRHQRYIQSLQETIDHLQPAVQIARVNMQQKQAKLSRAHIEVKKFEKIVEHKQEEQWNFMKHEETKQMDELSMQQYLNFQNR
ncbi:flagellar export protein FliJ [Halobacillus sp. HZG1]|uniref:flagellar export protein FliJ n=1 Tax=Halobacillus sp. HZG1 TaxID=3111769 RepID=UPI002DBF5B59|nr:flagellar export protein FliJ [Halobacillus sp. HZG1]MEC3886083.1 flagellar export protein FliJ [Halobacillus sp. HZG1]